MICIASLLIYCVNFSDTSKWSMKVILAFFKIDSSLVSLFATDIISNRYLLFFHYAFECPIILKLCLWMSHNSENYVWKLQLYFIIGQLNSQNYSRTLDSDLTNNRGHTPHKTSTIPWNYYLCFEVSMIL